MDPALGCAEIHALLPTLPALHSPADVDFSNGLYFFYEAGESSAHAPDGRVVRIGNHPHARDGLVARLNNHYRGGKNGSVFRRQLGGALLRRDNPATACLAPGPGQGHWDHQDDRPCPACRSTESAVTDLLKASFYFRCVRVDNQSLRNRLESRLIASVAACEVCRPSATWLGRYAYPALVRSSGLWNTQHIGGPAATSRDLELFAQLV
ncbi:MAG: hypothetical protein WCB85_14320 [Candidatus Dormiibacterota bacterium]